MKKTLKFKFSKLRAELAIILVAAIILSMACIANFGVFAETQDLGLTLKGGPDYTFTGEKFQPQLIVEAEQELSVSSDITKIKLDLKMPDIETLRPNMKYGDRAANTMYYGEDALGIYFSGTSVKKVGVKQADIFAALDNNKTALAAGETITMVFELKGEFKSNSKITKFNMMLSNNTEAGIFAGKAISISNIVFNPTSMAPGGGEGGDGGAEGGSDTEFNKLVLKDGPDFKFVANAWDPQLSVEVTNECIAKEAYDKIRFDLKMPDVEVLRSLMTWGSKGGGSSYDSYGYGGGDFAIYFSGENVKRVGVKQEDFFAALDANKEALKAGEAVPMEFELSGTFTEGGKITGINIMVAHHSTSTPDLSAFTDSPISIANMEFPYVITEYPLDLKNAPDYKFVANAWEPQLSVELNNSIKVNPTIDKIEFELKLPDVEILRPLMTAGSRGGGATFDGFAVYSLDAFALYFTGTDVTRVGVTQSEFYAALDANKEALAAGESVKLSFDLSGSFVEGGEITGINIMVAHDCTTTPDLSAFGDKPISFSNMMLKVSSANEEMAENQIAIKKGPEYVLSGAQWYPQLNIECKPYALKTTDKFMQIELSISDIDKLLESFTMGSRVTVGGVIVDDQPKKEFSYSGSDLGIWFEGDNVSQVGVTQGDLQAVLTKYRVPLSQGETVTLELPIKADVDGANPLPEGAKISKLCFMMSHDATADNLNGIKFVINKISVTEESVVPELEASELKAEDIKSVDEKLTVVDFEKKKIYVIANSTVGDLLNNIVINEEAGFSGIVTWEGSRMSNKSKLIDDYDFAYSVAVPNGEDVVFSVIPCNKRGGEIDITSPILNTKDPTIGGNEEPDEPGDTEDEDPILGDDYSDDYDEDYYDDSEEIIEGTQQETVVIPSTSGGKNKVVKQTVTENIDLYTTPQLIILIAASVLAGAAIMFIIDMFRFKKIAFLKKK